MSLDLAHMIFTPGRMGSLVFGTGALGAAALGVITAIPPISRRLMPLPKETRLVDFMPFTKFLADGATIQTKRGDLVRVIKVDGAELQTSNKNEHMTLFLQRRTWLSQIAEKKARVRVFTVRTAIDPDQMVEHPIEHMKMLSDKWEGGFKGTSFQTDHYIVLSTDKSVGETGIDEATTLTINALAPFRPRQLDAKSVESPLKILGRLASPISKPSPIPRPNVDVSEQIVADHVHFADDKTGLITFSSGDKERFVAILGIKAWGDLTEEKMLADLAALTFDYTIYHHIEPLNRAKATTTLDISYRLARTTFLPEAAQDQFADVGEIIAGAGQDTQVLCNYGLNLVVEGDTKEELNKRISNINAIAAQYQVTLVREGFVAHALWWSMFPTYDALPRLWRPLAANVATLLALQRNSRGADRSPWGEGPVTVLRTSTGAPYNFVFHDMADPNNKEPLGHMLVIGPSGSGKTLTTSWLAMMAMRHPELRVFFFDRFNGTEVVTNMAGGKYVKFDGTGAAMNPLQMELNERNRDYLNTWFRLITGLEDEKASEEFGRALDMMEHMPREGRNLKKLWQTAFSADGDVRSKIGPWIRDQENGRIFCAPEDTMDLDTRMVAFDFTNILDPDRSDALGPAVVSYIMHRTMDVSVRRGHPALYFVDETAPLLKNKYFAAKFAAGLQEGRKLGQVFICAFQRPNALEETEHGQMILGQCATQIFFPNAKAKEEDFALFKFNDREMDFVLNRTHLHMPRRFLLRRMSEQDGIDSVIIDANMAALGNGLSTFASGNASVFAIRDAMEKDPENFRDLYMEKVSSKR